MEIKPQELRLTNLVEWNKEACSVQSIRGNDISLHDVNGALICTTTKLIKPIELTPEWLERANFQLIDETMASGVEGIKGPYYAKDALLLWSNGSEPKSAYLVYYAAGVMGKYYAVPGRWIHTVHDLQNTYHAWKCEELAIDKTSLKN